ncbi:proline dehydrogenase family protein [Phycisphaerales bacterium AB-hyl4]|uniref:L-glutamate gamma-semialdehyde dehydrogenase n=1 Tax=Natronomicrosphaera hydrolytica TaxID=3242702 RepID=A0ABV4U4Z9_9BACT
MKQQGEGALHVDAAGLSLEAVATAIGREMLDHMQAHQQGMMAASFWSDKMMDWATKDPAFKTQLFRFVDVFPVLGTPEAVRQHVDEYLRAPGVRMPPGLSAGLKAGALLPGTLTRTITGQIEQMARMFIAGEDAAAALPYLRKRWDEGVAFSLDLLGEACVSDVEAAVYQQRYLALIETLSEASRDWPGNTLLERDHRGPVPRVNVSLKISSLHPRIDPADHDRTIAQLLDRLEPILERAVERGVLINFDMEQHALKDLTLDLFMAAAERWPFHAGVVLQAYLRSAESDAKRLIEWTRKAERLVTVRLVKGAYWDYELAHAQQHGWPMPVWTDKRQTDACFERMTQRLIDATPREAGAPGTLLAVGSHNVRSVVAALAQLRKAGLPTEAVELQMLRGMADPIKAAAHEMGLRVREYVPIGELVPGMAYLVRRLLENTSNQSWLLGQASGKMNVEQLLAAPAPPEPDEVAINETTLNGASVHALSPRDDAVGDGEAFTNEPPRDFSVAAKREAFARAIADLDDIAPPAEVSAEEATAAVGVVRSAFDAWADRPVRERANLLIKAADLMRRDRDALSALVIRESGKPWRSADADVCEAIDFLEYYARQAVGLFDQRRLGRYIAEHNHVFHRPRGVAVVISPWNFPLAICTGMTSASLVTGNTAIVKPAEQTPRLARAMVDRLHAAGVPEDVVQLMPGRGETVGATLADDPRVALIAFTGSRQVGVELMRVAAKVTPGQHHTKRLICEMGGKNAIIVDASADPDLAVLEVRDAAFGYSGQKCSACSRVIVVGGRPSDGERFVERLIESTRALVVGDPREPSTDVGPVIDDEAAEKINAYIDIGKQEARLAYAGDVPVGLAAKVGKPFVAPHIFTEVQPEHRIAREEIFGPVLTVLQAKDIDEAIEIANASEYKLTGAIISRTPSHLAKARHRFAVGNLYLNRGSTGSLVGRQPFGGFGLSGVGEKAGGDAYLRQFVNSTVCTENALRSGFSPDVFDLLGEGESQHR